MTTTTPDSVRAMLAAGQLDVIIDVVDTNGHTARARAYAGWAATSTDAGALSLALVSAPGVWDADTRWIMSDRDVATLTLV